MKVKCGGLTFTSDFDSGNLAKVEFVSSSSKLHVAEKSSDSSSSSPSNRNVGDPSLKRSAAARTVSKVGLRSSPRASRLNPHAANKSSGPVGCGVPSPPARHQKDNVHSHSAAEKKSKVLEFKIWTKPDCGGTPFENSFRSWFHFGVEGGPPGTVIKIHVMNLNRQGKLFFYGMRPVYKVVPAKDGWKRIPGKVHYKCENDGNFVITFMHTLPKESSSIVYFAFTYPFSYTDCQKMLDDIDKEMESSLCLSESVTPPEDAVYYYRELLCYSLDGRRVDLLTVTSCKGLTKEREERLPHLFPDHLKPRCHVFCGKKVIFVSSRVHPGETPSSFVFNGFLKHLLRPGDPKASRLRHLYVFKLIPMLNPDGVYRGHFRTDTHGINLNRVYLIASPELHPSVYASRALLLHYHMFYSSSSCSSSSSSSGMLAKSQEILKADNADGDHVHFSTETKQFARDHDLVYSSMVHSDLIKVPLVKKVISPAYSMSSVKHSVNSTDDFEHIHHHPNLAFSVSLLHKGFSASEMYLPVPGACSVNSRTPLEYLFSNLSGNLGQKSSYDLRSKTFSGSNYSGSSNESPKNPVSPSRDSQVSFDLKDFRSSSDLEPSDAEEGMLSVCEPDPVALVTAVHPPKISPEKSGIAYYFDLHGHACKRGCFIYGNFFPDIDRKVECMLLAKLMSINCPYFDFSACNFSAENMCSGSRRDGQSKEGSGRVALHTFTGIIHSYTLECNYNTGPNSTFQLQGCDSSSQLNTGKSSAVFTPEVFAKIGESLLVSILDATCHNPQSRLSHSSLGSLEGVKAWLKKYAVAVSKRYKNNYLKKNVLSTAVSGLNFRGKSTQVSMESLRKGSHQEQVRMSHGARISRLATSTKRNIVGSPPLSNEQFLINFGMKCKRLHASGSSPDILRSPPSKCIDSLKKLLNPKNVSLTTARAGSQLRSTATPLKPVPRKCKGTGQRSGKNISTAASKSSTAQNALENSVCRKCDMTSKQQSGSSDVTTRTGQGTKKPFASPSGSPKHASKSKKKSSVPSLQSNLSSKGLLESTGNIRAKKKMQI